MNRRLFALAALVAAVLTAALLWSEPGVSAPSKLLPDLAALVTGSAQLDPRIPPLVAGYVPGEIPYFAVLSQPDDAAQAAQLTALARGTPIDVTTCSIGTGTARTSRASRPGPAKGRLPPTTTASTPASPPTRRSPSARSSPMRVSVSTPI